MFTFAALAKFSSTPSKHSCSTRRATTGLPQLGSVDLKLCYTFEYIRTCLLIILHQFEWSCISVCIVLTMYIYICNNGLVVFVYKWGT
jgi:hypothetical protein